MYHHRTLHYVGMPDQRRFNLAEFHAIPANFHLLIGTPEKMAAWEERQKTLEH